MKITIILAILFFSSICMSDEVPGSDISTVYEWSEDYKKTQEILKKNRDIRQHKIEESMNADPKMGESDPTSEMGYGDPCGLIVLPICDPGI